MRRSTLARLVGYAASVMFVLALGRRVRPEQMSLSPADDDMHRLGSRGVLVANELRMSMHVRLLERFRAEYQQSDKRFHSLDNKAQATAAIGGVFLAAIFAFAKDAPQPTPLLEMSLLLISLALLLISIISAIFAMRVSKLIRPPKGDLFRDMVHDLDISASSIEEYCQMSVGLYGSLCEHWSKAIESLHYSNHSKAIRVHTSQWVLVAAVVLVAVVTALTIVAT